jgi:L-alanine-DL-glutamate epimerase-like enolase superfamily enzyme
VPATRSDAAIDGVEVAAYRIPTDSPESDGTLTWDQTIAIVVHAEAGGRRGIGFTYAAAAAATLVHDTLMPVLIGLDAMDVPHAWSAMLHTIRNLGRPGVAACAIAAVDSALWDLKARLLNVPLIRLLGRVRDDVPVYGSGGFTSYSIDRLQRQLGGWAEAGMTRVKMKVGRAPADDLTRVTKARDAVGPQCELFVDANGAYTRKQALGFAEVFAECGVSWFEEPVSSDDLAGLRLLRDRAPAGMDITAGEYGYDLFYFRRMLEHGAVDVLQADATRCAGITGFLKTAALCEANAIPLSSHCAPSLHLHAGCAAVPVVHLEYFHDHARVERLLFDGAIVPHDGTLTPDLSRPGLGLELKRSDAARYAL